MAAVLQTFDVKISIVRPFLTKDLSVKDLQKINSTTSLKYETLKTLSNQGNLAQAEAPSEAEVVSELGKEIDKLIEIKQDFNDLMDQAERALKTIVFTYDVELAENEAIANAERAIFGSASGIIDFAKYKKLIDFEEIVNRELQERMVNNSGMLDVA